METWSKEVIAEKLATNDKWLERGILAIYARQTADEKAAFETKHHNRIGFNGADAEILSSFAVQIARWKPGGKYNTPLSEKQRAIARKKMVKYAGQLAKIAGQKGAA